MNERARRVRERFSFDATVDALIGFFERVHELRPGRPHCSRTVLMSEAHTFVHLSTRPVSLRGLLHARARPGPFWSGIQNGVQLVRSRFRWLVARIVSRCYVSRVLRQARAGRTADESNASGRSSGG